MFSSLQHPYIMSKFYGMEKAVQVSCSAERGRYFRNGIKEKPSHSVE